MSVSAINTNIDDYSNQELITLLQLDNTQSYDEKLVRESVKRALDGCLQINKTTTSTDVEIVQLLDFFRKAYLRIGSVRKFPINDEVKTQLGLHSLLPEVPRLSEPRVVEQIPYADSVPQPIFPLTTLKTKPEKYALGSVNPIDRESVTHVLIINSKFRTNNSNAFTGQSQSDRIRTLTINQPNFVLCNKIKDAITCGPDKSGSIGTVTDFTVELGSPYKDAISLKVAALTFDNFYYPISEYLGSNHFTITSFDYDPTAPNPSATIANVNVETITVEDGYYTSTELIALFNALFLASPIGGLAAVEVFEDTNKNKFIFRVNSAPPIPPPAGRQYGFDINFPSTTHPTREIYRQFGWMLGYRSAEYNFFTNYVATATSTLVVGYNPESCINLIGTTSFFLEVEDFNNNHPRVIDYNCNSQNSYQMNNLQVRIPNVSPFGSQTYEDSSDRVFRKRKYFGPVSIQKLRIRLLDENGVPINLNGGVFIVTMEIETLNKSTKNMVL
jgi:hypothetical protein